MRERSRVFQKRRNSSRPPPRMEAVDEIAEGIERHVLAQSHRHRKPTRPLRPSSACFAIDEPEDRTVHEMECKSRRPPSSPTDSDLPEHRHVGVVATEYPLVKRLLNRPDSGPSGPREHTPQPGASAPRGSPTLYRRHPVFVLSRAPNETLRAVLRPQPLTIALHRRRSRAGFKEGDRFSLTGVPDAAAHDPHAEGIGHVGLACVRVGARESGGRSGRPRETQSRVTRTLRAVQRGANS